jgi:arginase
MDAHGDFNTPATSISGYFDGMGLAVLTGGAWQGLLATVRRARPLPESAAILVGARDLDAPEALRLRDSAIRQISAAQLQQSRVVPDAVKAIKPDVSGLYLHVDLDVLDVGTARVNVYGAPGGLVGAELQSVVRGVCDESPVRAISLTAYDPGFDADQRVPPIALDTLRGIADSLTR